MAEFEFAAEAVEAIEEAENGIVDAAGEGAEEMGSTEKAEFQEVVEKSQAEVKEFFKSARIFEEMNASSIKSLKSFGNFVVKNIAIAAIFSGVSVKLTKLIHQTRGESKQHKKSQQKTLAVVRAIISLVKSENEMCTTIKDWLQTHKDDTITLDGFVVKMETIFEAKLDPISVAIGEAYEATRPLMKKVNCKTQWNLPQEEDIHNLLNASESYIKAFGNLRDFAEEHKTKLVVLTSLLDILTQVALGEIQGKVDALKDMPFK